MILRKRNDPFCVFPDTFDVCIRRPIELASRDVNKIALWN